MPFFNNSDTARNLIGFLAALPLAAVILAATYGSVSLLG